MSALAAIWYGATVAAASASGYTIILPLMIATVIASVLGRRLLGSTVYERKLLRRGIDCKRLRRRHPVTATVRCGDSLERAADLVADPAIMLPVLDGNDRFAGLVRRRLVLYAYRSVRSG